MSKIMKKPAKVADKYLEAVDVMKWDKKKNKYMPDVRYMTQKQIDEEFGGGGEANAMKAKVETTLSNI